VERKLVFSSACIASRKQVLFSKEAETLRPLNVRKVEVNSNDLEGAAVAAEDVEDEAEDRRRGRGREETDEEAAKRRKFFDEEAPELAESEDENEGEAFGQDAGDLRTMKKMTNPKLPSKEDVEAHELNHLPYRNWCPHCVKGRGVEAPHKRVEREEGAVPEVHVDFCFPGSVVGAGQSLTVVVARDRDSKMMLSEVIPTKGSTGKFAASRVVCFMRELGYGGATTIIKSDQEPAIVALTNDIVRLRAPALTQVEQSPVGSSGSNGIVERGIQSFQMMARVMKSALENK
jgi:hypothetical protein